jgi:peptide/nickel transport system permease protein
MRENESIGERGKENKYFETRAKKIRVLQRTNRRIVLMTVRAYVIRRIIVIIPTFFFISILIFSLIHLAPGDPVQAMVGRHPPSREAMQILREQLGLDQPVPVQYLLWVSRLLSGDLGYSYVSGRLVWDLVSEKLWHTIELMLLAEIVSVAIAVILGVIAAVKHHSIIDAICSLGALIGYSAPTFWLGLIGILVFAMMLKWLPAFGILTPGVTFASPLHALVDHLKHLILPVSILIITWTAYLFRLVRSSMLEVLQQDYITTARAKGVRERVVIYKHALRNALLPVVTYLGFSMGFLLSGAAVIEFIFSWPGLGDFMVTVARIQDYPVIMGLAMIIALMVLFANLAADVTYAVIDPRIRYD